MSDRRSNLLIFGKINAKLASVARNCLRMSGRSLYLGHRGKPGRCRFRHAGEAAAPNDRGRGDLRLDRQGRPVTAMGELPRRGTGIAGSRRPWTISATPDSPWISTSWWIAQTGSEFKAPLTMDRSCRLRGNENGSEVSPGAVQNHHHVASELPGNVQHGGNKPESHQDQVDHLVSHEDLPSAVRGHLALGLIKIW